MLKKVPGNPPVGRPRHKPLHISRVRVRVRVRRGVCSGVPRFPCGQAWSARSAHGGQSLIKTLLTAGLGCLACADCCYSKTLALECF